jgi:hypothetical protein
VPSLNLDLSYFEWPETLLLIGLLGKGAEVLPLRLKAYVGRAKAQEGRLSGFTDRGVEAVMGWWGEPGRAVAAMLRPGVGFLRQVEDGFEVMEREGVAWEEAQGHIAVYHARAVKAVKAKLEKMRTETVSSASSSASSTACGDIKQSPCSAVHGKEAPPDGGAGGETTSPPPSPPEPAVLTFPTVGKGAKAWGLTEAKVKEYSEAYPGVDVLAECKKALQWCRDNPRQQKTPQGMAAFLSRWLSKQQDRSSRRGFVAAGHGRRAEAGTGRGNEYDSTVQR